MVTRRETLSGLAALPMMLSGGSVELIDIEEELRLLVFFD